MTRWVIGGICVAVAVVAIIAMALTLASDRPTDVTDLDAGDCFDLDVDDTEGAGGDDEFAEVMLVETVGCDDPHDAQVLVIYELNPDHDAEFPGDEELYVEADRACRPYEDFDDRFGVLPITPTELTWDVRRGRTACIAVVFGGDQVVGDHGSLVVTTTPGDT